MFFWYSLNFFSWFSKNWLCMSCLGILFFVSLFQKQSNQNWFNSKTLLGDGATNFKCIYSTRQHFRNPWKHHILRWKFRIFRLKMNVFWFEFKNLTEANNLKLIIDDIHGWLENLVKNEWNLNSFFHMTSYRFKSIHFLLKYKHMQTCISL